jgi:hypothetical protein
MTAFMAGAAYFAIVYLAGFVLGTARVLLLVPRMGEMAAVLLEVPVILGASWMASRWSVDKFTVPAEPAPRLLMGTVALALLVCGEVAVSIFVFGRSWDGTLAAYRSPAGVAGLSAQMVFALLPLIQVTLPRQRIRSAIPAR